MRSAVGAVPELVYLEAHPLKSTQEPINGYLAETSTGYGYAGTALGER
jgi:hypothetical protein